MTFPGSRLNLHWVAMYEPFCYRIHRSWPCTRKWFGNDAGFAGFLTAGGAFTAINNVINGAAQCLHTRAKVVFDYSRAFDFTPLTPTSGNLNTLLALPPIKSATTSFLNPPSPSMRCVPTRSTHSFHSNCGKLVPNMTFFLPVVFANVRNSGG